MRALSDLLSGPLRDVLRRLGANSEWLGGAVALSLLILVGSVLVVPRVLARLPTDYFHNPYHRPLEHLRRRPALRWSLLLLKNCVGCVLVVAGLAMLVLPGQGLLTLFVALVLLDFPGKFALKRIVFGWQPVRRGLNALRRRWGQPPFEGLA
jgi:hypothetical protein